MFSKILPRSSVLSSVGLRTTIRSATTVTSQGNVKVISLDQKLPLSGAAVIVHGGSSFENSNNAGVSHFLEQSAYHGSAIPESLLTTHLKVFSNNGSTFSSNRSRETVTYSTVFPSDQEGQKSLPVLAKIASFQVYRWEFEPITHVVQRIQNQIRTCDQVQDSLHAQVFRSQPLGNHLYPSWNVGKVAVEDLHNFKSKTLERPITVVGVNVSHNLLEEHIAKNFTQTTTENKQNTKYIGGGEVRLFSSGSSVSVAVTFQGKSLADDAALTILSYVLGRQRTSELQQSRLQSLQSNSSQQIYTANSFVKSYSDNGLFGAYAVGQQNDLAHVLVQQIKSLSQLDATEFEAAKNAAIVDFLIETETTAGLLQHLATRGTGIQERVKALEQVTLDKAKSSVQELLKSAPSVVAFGNVHGLSPL